MYIVLRDESDSDLISRCSGACMLKPERIHVKRLLSLDRYTKKSTLEAVCEPERRVVDTML